MLKNRPTSVSLCTFYFANSNPVLTDGSDGNRRRIVSNSFALRGLQRRCSLCRTRQALSKNVLVARTGVDQFQSSHLCCLQAAVPRAALQAGVLLTLWFFRFLFRGIGRTPATSDQKDNVDVKCAMLCSWELFHQHGSKSQFQMRSLRCLTVSLKSQLCASLWLLRWRYPSWLALRVLVIDLHFSWRCLIHRIVI